MVFFSSNVIHEKWNSDLDKLLIIILFSAGITKSVELCIKKADTKFDILVLDSIRHGVPQKAIKFGVWIQNYVIHVYQ